ncbi:hypothetical protein MUK42_26356, partial [Musa troglodytarum]
RNESGDDVDQSRDDGGHQGGVVAETEGLEQDGSVEHDDVDAGELLEGGDQQGHAQLRPVFAPQQGAPWVPDDLGVFAGRDEVVVLGFDVVGSADLPKHGHGLLVVATLDQRVGGIGEEEGADGDDDGWHGSEAQAQAPAPPALDLVGGIVHQVGDEDADGDHKLEGNVEHPAELRRSHLREFDRPRKLTWLANPTPMPRRMRPMMSMATSLAPPLIAAPPRKMSPPPSMEILLPKALVTAEATKEATNAAR